MSIETVTLDNFIKVPCFRYFQAGRLFYSVTLPMNQLEKFLSIDNEFDVLKRSQRIVDKSRVKKLINYLEKDKFILPSLTGFIDGDCQFKEYGKDSGIGFLELSLDCVIKLFDGQHRASGIVSACKKSYELRYKLQKSSITLNLTNSLTLQERQQFFSDINTNVSKPSISLSSVYNQQDSRSVFATKIIDWLRMTNIIEYEKNVISKDEKFKAFTFKSFVDSVTKAFGLKKNTDITPDLLAQGEIIYKAWSSKFHWVDSIDISYQKQNTLNYHNLMIIIIGDVTKRLLEKHSAYDVSKKIEDSTFDYLTLFRITDLYDVCVDKETNRVKLDADSKYKAIDRLLYALDDK
ncbi:hypothetical protein A9G13_02210 [Gilliamella sp. wkB178]|uniref:DGQHR domain-containing protein n=1 Tax=Gilliamella sp. wkB178 TaxID=3120259 RepID=UPI00080E3482|nr:DGQHR domain-containing protein [Gilliamella apicola]OCG08897.1 hypothetical protein A9G13_02210 [Gilliamella apicola]